MVAASASHRSCWIAAAVILAALALQVALMVHIGERAYGDVIKALHFGSRLESGDYRISENRIHTKTFVGPVITWAIFRAGGLNALHAANIAAFLGIALLAMRLWRGYAWDTRLLALLLLAFYVGTIRSIVAGELDDQIATLLLAAGVLLILARPSVLPGALLIGVGFLFKFWVAIFGVAVAAWLVHQRRLRELPIAIAGMGAPFLALVPLDGGNSFRWLLASPGIHGGFSTWSAVLVKVFTTALLPSAVVATLEWRHRRGREDTLFLLLGLIYLAYVFAARDSHAASTMMMTCLVFWAPLLASWILGRLRQVLPRHSLAAAVAFAALYVATCTTVGGFHLKRDGMSIEHYRNAVLPWKMRNDREGKAARRR